MTKYMPVYMLYVHVLAWLYAKNDVALGISAIVLIGSKVGDHT